VVDDSVPSGGRRRAALAAGAAVILLGAGGVAYGVADRPGKPGPVLAGEPGVPAVPPSASVEPSVAPSRSVAASRSAASSPKPAVASTHPKAPSGCGSVSAKLVPACGAWLGLWPRTQADGTTTNNLASNLTSLEGRLGREVDLVSRYYGWGQSLPDATDRSWRDSGHLVLVDLRARNFSTNAYTSWATIAGGSQDAYLRQVAASLKAFGSRIFFSFNQEPEQELEKGTQVAGTAADYVAAYRHIHDVFASAGVTNVVYVWWTMGCTCHLAWYPSLYPGDAYVDWISYDPYNFNACHGAANKSVADSLTPFYRWLGENHLGDGKPLMLSEFGANGASQGSWYSGVGTVLKTLPRIKAAIEFDSAPGGCDTRITASTDDWNGFASIAADPYFRQPGA
jgi:hypothetical protein